MSIAVASRPGPPGHRGAERWTRREHERSAGERRATYHGRRGQAVGDQIGVDWDRFDLEQFRAGMDVEYDTATTTLKPT